MVTYAASRGIRVVVEFDGPGHAFGMALGYPEIGTNCGSGAVFKRGVRGLGNSGLMAPF